MLWTTPSRLLTFTALAVTFASAGTLPNVVAPAFKGVPNSVGNVLDVDANPTDSDTIASTAQIVDQKSGPTADTPPNLPIPETVVTAVDGQLTDAGNLSAVSANLPLAAKPVANKPISVSKPPIKASSKRDASQYQLVFSGTGTRSTDRDASIQGTAYLTYRTVDNSTYNIDACLDFCSSESKCVFANLYYEFNNEGLDRDGSNLKCAIYGDVHTAAEKTNFGGQSSYASGDSLTYIQQSSGWSSKELVEPENPQGYDLVFGPTGGANNAPGYMGFAFLDKYDVDACARECNQRGADGNGGACQFFNIWRAVVNGIPTTYSCSMYYIVADASSAVNTGQGDLKVTFSRGYQRKNYLVDGGFEGYTACSDFCYTDAYANWVGTSPANGYLDATIFYFSSYAHSGHGSGLLGAATYADTQSGTLTAAKPLDTVAGNKYQIAFFQNSAFSGPALQAPSFLQVVWNGNVVSTIRPGFSDWRFFSVDVVAVGGDVLAFSGGAAPAWIFLDDISVWPANN